MSDPGWPWTEVTPPVESLDLARACARLFGGDDGRLLLAHLRRITLARCLAADAPEPLLRHLEGQRALVLTLESLVARGRSAPL
jgi:hypothetical protein